MKPATKDQLSFMRDLLERLGEGDEEILDDYQVDGLEELTVSQASEVIDHLKAMLR